MLGGPQSLRVNGNHFASCASDTRNSPSLSIYLRTSPTLWDGPEQRVELLVLTPAHC